MLHHRTASNTRNAKWQWLRGGEVRQQGTLAAYASQCMHALQEWALLQVHTYRFL